MTLKKTELILVTGLLLSSLCTILFPESYTGAMLRSLAIQATMFSFGFCVYLVVRKRWGLLLITNFAGLIFFSLLPKFYPVNGNTNEPALKVAQFNVFRLNPWRTSVINTAKTSGADIISFQEVSTKWADSLLEAFCKEYPYSEILPCDLTMQGIAVFSKLPLCNVRVIYFQNMPNIAGDILLEEGNVHFIASHLTSPITYSAFKCRNRHLQDIANYLNSIEGPKIALGDYNAVPWDVMIKNFKVKTGLSDSRSSLVPTFPSRIKFLQIPIDYIFHCNQITCIHFNSLQPTSSDHLGVIGYYQIIHYTG